MLLNRAHVVSVRVCVFLGTQTHFPWGCSAVLRAVCGFMETDKPTNRQTDLCLLPRAGCWCFLLFVSSSGVVSAYDCDLYLTSLGTNDVGYLPVPGRLSFQAKELFKDFTPLFFFVVFNLYFMCCRSFACMYFCAPHVCLVPKDAQRGHPSPWSQKHLLDQFLPDLECASCSGLQSLRSSSASKC